MSLLSTEWVVNMKECMYILENLSGEGPEHGDKLAILPNTQQ